MCYFNLRVKLHHCYSLLYGIYNPFWILNIVLKSLCILCVASTNNYNVLRLNLLLSAILLLIQCVRMACVALFVGEILFLFMHSALTKTKITRFSENHIVLNLFVLL